METGRRRFLRLASAAMAAGALPDLGWADAGAPAYLAAAREPSGEFALFGLASDGSERFRLPLPGRGHAAAAHPSAPLAVAFARRPGRFALVIDCALGAEIARLEAPQGRHFYGHGAFDASGDRLFTCENAYDSGEGVIGIWDVRAGFERMGEFASGGVGPHELVFDAQRGRVIVANGGIQTHPDSGRAKLNLPIMRPSLAYMDAADGSIRQIIEPPEALRLNSLRHLALAPHGLVAIAAQWQGDPAAAPPLLAFHRAGDEGLAFASAPLPEQARLNGYAGSVAFSGDGSRAAITGPRGGRLHLFDTESASFLTALAIPDVCGVAPHAEGFLATDGYGGVRRVSSEGQEKEPLQRPQAWDNHLVSLLNS